MSREEATRAPSEHISSHGDRAGTPGGVQAQTLPIFPHFFSFLCFSSFLSLYFQSHHL